MAIERKPILLENSVAALGVRQRCRARVSNRGKLPWVQMASALLVVLSAVACKSPEPQARQRMNVLLLSLDSLRADRLGVYGNERDVSPTIDRLATGGIRFAHAVSPTSWTLPVHVTLLTGLEQRHHGVVNVSHSIADSIETMPEVFARAGYETFGIYSGPFLDPAYGFAQGFHQYVSCMSEATAGASGKVAWKNSHSDQTNPSIVRSFEEWLRNRSERPFFAFVHLWDVHYDYIPPEPYYSMFDPQYSGALDGRRIAYDGFPLSASAADVHHLLSLYDGEIRYTDATIARLLGALESHGLIENTLIVLTADHGEEFKEHGNKGHQKTLYQEIIHVPLIFSAANRLPVGMVVEEPVALSDVAPTIAEIVGIPFPAVDGRSLLPLVRGEEYERQPIFSEFYLPHEVRLFAASVRLGNQKVIYHPQVERWETYDLAMDPGENAAVESDFGALHQNLIEHSRASEALLTRRKSRERSAVPADLPAEVAEKLRQLGYLDGEPVPSP
jgi:arylsulfatase A-like enzyme